jgi:hypothetical protein
VKLSKRQRTALEKSIKKWEGIVDGKKSDHGNNDCDCCIKYNYAGCRKCPVYLKTGLDTCFGTPYTEFTKYCRSSGIFSHGTYLKVFDDHSKKLAQAELDFLRNIMNEATS